MDADGALDEGVWDRLTDMIGAAHEMHRESYWALARSMADEVALPGHQRAGLYLWYLLRNALGGKVGERVPTDAELVRISCDYFARFSGLVDADRPVLEDLFRKVFERAPVKKEIGPGGLLALAPAALGVLYEEPGAELSRMKPRLNSWWQRYAQKFHSQGLLR
jgi:hypothetical protein